MCWASRRRPTSARSSALLRRAEGHFAGERCSRLHEFARRVRSGEKPGDVPSALPVEQEVPNAEMPEFLDATPPPGSGLDNQSAGLTPTTYLSRASFAPGGGQTRPASMNFCKRSRPSRTRKYSRRWTNRTTSSAKSRSSLIRGQSRTLLGVGISPRCSALANTTIFLPGAANIGTRTRHCWKIIQPFGTRRRMRTPRTTTMLPRRRDICTCITCSPRLSISNG